MSLEVYHDMAMDERVEVACAGRALKLIHNAIEAWWNQERERGETCKMDMICAAPTIAANVVVSIVHQVCAQAGMPTKEEAHFLGRIGEMLGSGLVDGAKAMAQDPNWHEGGGVFNATKGERQRNH